MFQTIIIPLLLSLSLSPLGVSSQSDCATVLAVYKALGGTTSLTNGCSIPGVRLSGSSVAYITWRDMNLRGYISSDIGKLSGLKQLFLYSNQITGSIPKELGKLTSLTALRLHNNQLSGPIPAEIGNLSSLETLYLNNNRLTGVPSSVSALKNRLRALVIFPNPMSTIPYDVFSVNPASTLTPTNWTNLLATPPRLVRRQLTSSMSAEDLYRLCPLNNVTSKEVVAGCVAGIYNRFCKGQSNLTTCQTSYDTVVSQSYFQPLGLCAAWKLGPRSVDCGTAISRFSVPLDYGTLTSTNARDFVTSIFSSRVYAPCVAPTCRW